MRGLFFILSVCVTFSSCSIIPGLNYNNSEKVQKLHLGMTKEDVIKVMGKQYAIESVSREENGVLEIFRYYSSESTPYLLHFLNGELILFNRYYPPSVPQQNITITHGRQE